MVGIDDVALTPTLLGQSRSQHVVALLRLQNPRDLMAAAKQGTLIGCWTSVKLPSATE